MKINLKDDLIKHFESGCKKNLSIGVENEKFLFDFKPVKYISDSVHHLTGPEVTKVLAGHILYNNTNVSLHNVYEIADKIEKIDETSITGVIQYLKGTYDWTESTVTKTQNLHNIKT